MRSTHEAYAKVAENCSSFEAKKDCDCYSNSSCSCSPVSCTNCGHFDIDEFCRLDLYDKIIRDCNISC